VQAQPSTRPLGCVNPGYLASLGDFCHESEIARETSKWWADFAWSWRAAADPIARRWESRARSARVQGDRGRQLYAQRRADSLRIDKRVKLDVCGVRKMQIRCACKELRIPVPCRERWLCEFCRRQYYGRLRKRLLRATRAQTRLANKRQRWAMIRLSVRHSGNLARDRERISEGFKRLRQWLWKKVGQFPYVLVWEVTPGTTGAGHVHAHVIALWPWIDYADVHQEWVRATGGESTHIDIRPAQKGASGAAFYVSKYVSKGVEVCKFPAVLSGRVLAAFYNRRIVQCSRRFFSAPSKLCKCCGKHWRVTELPLPLAQVTPFEVWRAKAMIVSWPLQTELEGMFGVPP